MVEFSTRPPWWRTETYDLDLTQPQALTDRCGPHGVATVTVNSNGSTQEGWGLTGKNGAPGFMPRYTHGEFNSRRTMWQYSKRGVPFAFVMRSLSVVCIDIDGKNGGFASAVQLGRLPITLAETSKSGNGYHLFYALDEAWDDQLGFNLFDDHIGLVQGIDIRATGCVYHYPTQRWNGRDLVPVPDFLSDMLTEKRQRRLAAQSTLTKMKEMDEVDALVAQHELLEELAKPIAAGKRNNTLFAIGSKLNAASVPDWQEALRERGNQIGLDFNEVEKIIDNIVAYG